MILCRDCKHLKVYDDANTVACHLEQFDYTSQACINIDCMSCHHAERADGLTVCCETCQHNRTEWSEEHVGKRTHAKCLKNRFDIIVFHDDLFDVFEMSCPEWQAREGK